MRRLLLTLTLVGCAADRSELQTTEVGITVLPVASQAQSSADRVRTRPPSTTSTPAGGSREEAERYFTEARSAMAANRVEEACGLFRKSFEADPAIGTMLNLGDCNEKLGNIPAACNAYRDAEAQARPLGQGDRAELARTRAQNLGCR